MIRLLVRFNGIEESISIRAHRSNSTIHWSVANTTSRQNVVATASTTFKEKQKECNTRTSAALSACVSSRSPVVRGHPFIKAFCKEGGGAWSKADRGLGGGG